MDSPVFKLEKVVRAKTEDMEDFVGPLDLILHLLSKNKIEIADIQISVILEQYIKYLEDMKRMDLEIASEFVAMAAHLMYIKTRMLLSESDEQALSEMDLLIRSLEERQREESYAGIKAVTGKLSEMSETGRNNIIKGPEYFERDKSYQYAHKREELTESMRELFRRSKGKLPPPVSVIGNVIGKEPYSIAKKTSEILKKLIHTGKTRFHSLFSDNHSRSEIVATFMAVLDLCSARSIRLSGNERDYIVTYKKREKSVKEG